MKKEKLIIKYDYVNEIEQKEIEKLHHDISEEIIDEKEMVKL